MAVALIPRIRLDVGLARFRSWPLTLGLGVALGVAMEVLQLFVTQPFLVLVTKRAPDLSFFRRLAGNPKLLVVMLLLVWTLAALGEELVYRVSFEPPGRFWEGYQGGLGHQLALDEHRVGFAHYEQGIAGIIDEGFMGFLLGLAYLACDRKLAVPIVAHGIQDTVDMILLFLRKYPGI